MVVHGREIHQALIASSVEMAVEEVNLQHGQGGRLRGKRRRSATDMGVEKAAPGRPTDVKLTVATNFLARLKLEQGFFLGDHVLLGLLLEANQQP